MNLSVCMIVRNEEKYLPRALANLKGAVDEILIFDTGSTDNTVRIAKEAGCVVYEGGDRMNKGKARTTAMQLSTGDYWLVLDADENIQDPQAVRAEIEKSQADVYYIRLAFMNGDKQTLSYAQARIFKAGKVEYKYRAHEVPVWDKSAKVLWTDLIWEHRPPADRIEDKKIYALERLLLDVKENPNEARPLYYLGRQYFYLKQYQAAINTLKAYLAKGSNDSADALYFIASAFKELNQLSEAVNYLYQAIALKPNHREYWCLLSDWYKAKGELDLAYSALRFIEKLPAPKHDYLWNRYYGADFYDSLALSAYAVGDFIQATSAGMKALSLNPDSARLKKNLEFYKQKAGN